MEIISGLDMCSKISLNAFVSYFAENAITWEAGEGSWGMTNCLNLPRSEVNKRLKLLFREQKLIDTT